MNIATVLIKQTVLHELLQQRLTSEQGIASRVTQTDETVVIRIDGEA